MKKWSLGAWVALVCFATGAASVQAQEVNYASATDFNERINQLEIELASYRSAIGEVCADSCDLGCGTECTSSTCLNCCPQGGFIAGVEVSFLKPYHAEGHVSNYDYTATPRVWVGYQSADGLGIRGRWWEMDANGPATSQFDQIHMRTIDLEITDTFTLGRKLSGLVSGGFRYAEYREDDSAGAGFRSQQHAMGLVVGAELRRSISGGFNLFGMGRTSILFSESNIDSGVVGDENTTFMITELQLGVEYNRAIMEGNANLFARVSAETQFWNGVSHDDSEDIALMGLGFAVGVTR